MAHRRGLTTITAGAEELPLLFNNFSLGEVEKDLKIGIPAILRGYDETGRSGLREVSVLIQHGANEARRAGLSSGKRLTYIEATRVQDRFGFVNIVAPIFEAVAEVLTYDPNDEDDHAPDGESKNA